MKPRRPEPKAQGREGGHRLHSPGVEVHWGNRRRSGCGVDVGDLELLSLPPHPQGVTKWGCMQCQMPKRPGPGPLACTSGYGVVARKQNKNLVPPSPTEAPLNSSTSIPSGNTQKKDLKRSSRKSTPALLLMEFSISTTHKSTFSKLIFDIMTTHSDKMPHVKHVLDSLLRVFRPPPPRHARPQGRRMSIHKEGRRRYSGHMDRRARKGPSRNRLVLLCRRTPQAGGAYGGMGT